MNDLLDALLAADTALRQALARAGCLGDVLATLRRLSSQMDRFGNHGWPDAHDWCVKLVGIDRDIRLAARRPRQRGLRAEYRRALSILAPLIAPAKRELEYAGS